MFKYKIIINALVPAILACFTLQTVMFVATVSSRKNSGGTVYATPSVPLSGVDITVFSGSGAGYAVTNLVGQYSITEGLPDGTYTVTAFKEGYISSEVKNIVVNVGSEHSGVNLYLNRSGGISGRITDAVNSLPLPNITVMASQFSGSDPFIGVDTSDTTGYYNINTNLATGLYNVSVLFPKGHQGKSVGPIAVTAGNITKPIDLTLDRSGIIYGQITNPSGQPLPNLTVTANSTDFTSFGTDNTNATGYYKIDSGLSSGNYTVMVISDSVSNQTSNINVDAAGNPVQVNMQLLVVPPPESGTIMGRVVDNTSRPVEYAHVWADGETTDSYGDTFTNEKGYYVISEGLETDDNYTVGASAVGYQDAEILGVDVLVGGVTPDINLQLQKIPPTQSGRISGTVTGDENPIPEFRYSIAVMFILSGFAVSISKIRSSKTRSLV